MLPIDNPLLKQCVKELTETIKRTNYFIDDVKAKEYSKNTVYVCLKPHVNPMGKAFTYFLHDMSDGTVFVQSKYLEVSREYEQFEAWKTFAKNDGLSLKHVGRFSEFSIKDHNDFVLTEVATPETFYDALLRMNRTEQKIKIN